MSTKKCAGFQNAFPDFRRESAWVVRTSAKISLPMFSVRPILLLLLVLLAFVLLRRVLRR
jgi:hypothetical protein